MNNKLVVIALVAAATAIICTGLVIYFNPFHTCVRAQAEGYENPYDNAQVVFRCTRAAGGQ